ncbi:hypothetical protein F511_08316 [Dorcoceras hygrometricum]|uniref:Uncharacterized protein n=1 Tax=Dorcoceras hygrometricum TaxID=472368 RepID=A0A2Z7BBY0_9LAMI|nr:hypothetical protein F511_08316 [Dorcoceras hygrometricum]
MAYIILSVNRYLTTGLNNATDPSLLELAADILRQNSLRLLLILAMRLISNTYRNSTTQNPMTNPTKLINHDSNFSVLTLLLKLLRCRLMLEEPMIVELMLRIRELKKSDETELWFNLSYEEFATREDNRPLEIGIDTEEEFVTEKVTAIDVVVQTETGSGVDEGDWYKASLPKINSADKGKAPLQERDPVKGNPVKEQFLLIVADIELLVKSSSRRPQPPPDDQNRPSGGSASRGSGSGGSSRRDDRRGSSKRRSRSGGGGSGTGGEPYGPYKKDTGYWLFGKNQF